MTITLTPEQEAQLTAQAKAAGLPPADYAAQMLSAQLARTPPTLSDEAWDTLLQSETVNAPPIPPEALRRENLYEDRN